MGDEQDRYGALVDHDGAHAPTGVERDQALPADPDKTVEVEVDANLDRPPAARIRDLERFDIIGELGRGGMGVVLAAHDPNLDRKIALKVIHRQPIPGGSDGTERLLREARALAKLTHPNVVAIHDVGHMGEDLYLAMEYVDGPTLEAWLASEERAWPDILAKFRQAGRGLAAAHAAGLVHRDFKPANVLIGSDGRARVSDFGLVSSAGMLAEEDGLSQMSPSTPISTSLTVPGTLLGTPLFMAPEQHLRQPVDARSDQFSFCVALYQALFAAHPFTGNSYLELRDNVLERDYRPIPRDSPVPRHVRAAIMRGLARDPALRFPNMDELLYALDRRAGARWVPALAGVAVAAGAALALWLSRAAAPDVCALPAAAWAGIWDADTRDRAGAAFAAAQRPYAADTFARAAELIDSYVEDWSQMRTSACRARKRGPGKVLFDVRMRCLERRRSHVAALTGRFTTSVDGAVVDDAITAAAALPALSACADDDALAAAIPLPEDPELRARIAELEGRLGESAVAEELGKYDEAQSIAAAVMTDSADIDFAPLRAEAGFRLGKAQGKSGDAKSAEASLRAAMRTAATAHDDELAARASIELIFILGDAEHRFDDALALRDSAAAAVTRAGSPAMLRARLLHTVATVLTGKGDFAAAEKLFEEAIALRSAEVGADHITVGASLTNLGLALWRQQRLAEARPLFERSLAILSAGLGANHPDVARAHNNLSNALRAQGDLEGAERNLERAIAIWRAAFGDRHPNLARPLANRGNISYARGDLDGARKDFEAARDILIASRGPEHPDTAKVLHNLANVLSDSGELAEAKRTFERVLRIREKAFGVNHPACASTAGSLGMLLVGMKDFAGARAHLERALAIDERVFGRDHINVAYSLLALGTMAIEEGTPRAALAPLERALTIWIASQADASDIAETEFELARALWQSRSDRRRALTLAASARVRYAAAGAPARKQLERVESWLAER